MVGDREGFLVLAASSSKEEVKIAAALAGEKDRKS